AALVAAGLFGTSRLHYPVLANAVGLGDLLALAFILSTCIGLTFTSHRARVLTLLAYGAALLSKESVCLIPACLLAHPAIGASMRDRLKQLGPVLIAGFLWLTYLFSTATSSVFGGPAYERRFGLNLLDALVTYGQWS